MSKYKMSELEQSGLLNGRAYLADIPGSRVVEHGYSGTDLAEKADELGIRPRQVVKTIFFELRDSGSEDSGSIDGIVGVVVPSTARVVQRNLASYLGISRTRAERMVFAETLPEGQDNQTCGPFIKESDQGLVSHIIFDQSVLVNDVLEFAVPGNKTSSFLVPAEGLVKALTRALPGTTYTVGEVARYGD